MSDTVEEVVAGYLRHNAVKIAAALEAGRDDAMVESDVLALAMFIASGNVLSDDTLEAPRPLDLLDTAIREFIDNATLPGVTNEWVLSVEVHVAGSSRGGVVAVASHECTPAHARGILLTGIDVVLSSGTAVTVHE